MKVILLVAMVVLFIAVNKQYGKEPVIE